MLYIITGLVVGVLSALLVRTTGQVIVFGVFGGLVWGGFVRWAGERD